MSENKQTKKECKDFMLKEYYLYINESRRSAFTFTIYFHIFIFSYFPYIYIFYNIGISFFFLTVSYHYIYSLFNRKNAVIILEQATF